MFDEKYVWNILRIFGTYLVWHFCNIWPKHLRNTDLDWRCILQGSPQD
jgi:hypothetical protein